MLKLHIDRNKHLVTYLERVLVMGYDLDKLCEKYFNRIKEIRHKIHMYPEISFKEFKTSELIYNELKNIGIPCKNKIATTGVVGELNCKKDGKTVLLRADMDALPMQEFTDSPFKSKVDGVMHSCGHDGHVAGLLGACMILNEIKDCINGNVKFVFQPAEEKYGGALPMIDDGVLKNPDVDVAFATHVLGTLKEGKIATKKGAVMASPDDFTIKIIGKGGHGATPHLAVDPIVIASEVVLALQTVVSRKINPLKSCVVTCGYINGGTTVNVIPEIVDIGGTVRTFCKETRELMPKIMEDIVSGITKSHNASYEFSYTRNYPPLINDDYITEFTSKALSDLIGKENVSTNIEPMMGGEDFAYFCENVPSCFFFTGICKDENNPIPHHNPNFNFDDENLKLITKSFVELTIKYLNEH